MLSSDSSNISKALSWNETDLDTRYTEGGIVYAIAFVGILGNVAVLLAVMMFKKLRHAATAFLSHHCLLDLIKSAFCITLGYSLQHRQEIPHCNWFGTVYIILMTASAYNLFAIVVNEEYHMIYYRQNYNNYLCISFGLFMIWFASILIHLGVGFLPSRLHYNKDIGFCSFKQGIPSSVVTHVCWLILITFAITLTLVGLWFLHQKVQYHAYTPQNVFGEDFLAHDEKDILWEIETDELHSDVQPFFIDNHRRRVFMLIGMTATYLLCWLPLFAITIFDVNFILKPQLYKILTIVAWSQPITTPVFASVYLWDIADKFNLEKDLQNKIAQINHKDMEASQVETTYNTASTALLRQPVSFQNRLLNTPTSLASSECGEVSSMRRHMDYMESMGHSGITNEGALSLSSLPRGHGSLWMRQDASL
ncbi:prokineticin receptor 2-like [Octopus sinensis]|uniref:Prokineticin receptor 2-like n=1 Tax=Octopus sinensis TaxID=2607531 RepID=A0A7E6FJJ8_9MOLL|nr:prokineticin receptor 2-like [Octopus sinensis]